MGADSPGHHAPSFKRWPTGRLIYLYDTVRGAWDVTDHAEHRLAQAALLQRSRYSIVYRINDEPSRVDRTGGEESLTNRYFESLAAGMVMLGSAPDSDGVGTTASRGRTRSSPSLPLSPASSRSRSSTGTPRGWRARVAAMTTFLTRHDWAHRWRDVLSLVGLEESPRMAERLDHLASRRAEWETSSAAVTAGPPDRLPTCGEGRAVRAGAAPADVKAGNLSERSRWGSDRHARGTRTMSFDAVVDTDGVARASRHTLLAQLATQVSRLAVNVILARLLTPSDFGVVAVAMVVMVVAWQLTDLGTSAVIIQRDVHRRRPGQLAVLLQSPPRCRPLGGHVRRCRPTRGPLGSLRLLQPSRCWPAVCFLGAVGNMHYALLRRTMQFGRLATISIANAVVNGVVGISLAVAGAGLWALVAGTVAGTAVSTVASWWYEAWRPSATFSLRRLRTVARFSIHFFYSSASRSPSPSWTR